MASEISKYNHSVYLNDIVRMDHDLDHYEHESFLKLFNQILQYVLTRPWENFATLEERLRSNGCTARLYAKEALSGPGFTVSLHGRDCLYQIFMTTKDPEIAEQEILKNSGDPETNMIRLLKTGCPTFEQATDVLKFPLKRGESIEMTSEGTRMFFEELKNRKENLSK